MRTRTAALLLTGSLTAGAVGAIAITPASAESSSNPVSSRLAHLKSALSGLVSDGTLTQSQADKVAETLDKALPQRGDGPGRPGFGHGHGPRGLIKNQLDAAAKAIGVTAEGLRTQLRDGTSIADVAKSKGVAVDTVVKAMVDAAKADLAAVVKAGKLTQAQADKISANLTTRITNMVNHVRPPRPDRAPDSPGDGDGGGPDDAGSAQPTSNA